LISWLDAHVLPIVFTIECRVGISIWRLDLVFIKHVILWCFLFDPHRTTYQSNLGVHQKTSHLKPNYLIGWWKATSTMWYGNTQSVKMCHEKGVLHEVLKFEISQTRSNHEGGLLLWCWIPSFYEVSFWVIGLWPCNLSKRGCSNYCFLTSNGFSLFFPQYYHSQNLHGTSWM
jgi:hypothetical protein